MNNILKPKTQEETDFYKFAKTSFEKDNLQMKTDIDFAMLYSCMNVYTIYAKSHGFPSELLEELMTEFYLLRVSKKRGGRNDIVEISKNSIQQEQKTQ
jgi:hypothetical protein